MKPLIAITCRKSTESETLQLSVNKNYSDCIIKAGGILILLLDYTPEDLIEVMNIVDGLLVTGGIDVDPSMYNEQKRLSCEKTDRDLDSQDILSINLAVKRNIPILGICRGLQIINVAFGGTLFQDIFDDLGIEDGKHNSRNTESLNLLDNGKHQILIEPSSSLFELFGDTTQVNTFHHQAINNCSDKLKIIARASDGIIEAIENDNILAVQWHPERMNEHQIIFDRFIQNCKISKSPLHK